MFFNLGMFLDVQQGCKLYVDKNIAVLYSNILKNIKKIWF